MKKIYSLLIAVLAFGEVVLAQPGALSTNNLTNGPVFYDCRALTSPSGAFKQARIQATLSSASVTWEFPATCAFPGDVWRPYLAGAGNAPFNTTIAPVGGTASALYNNVNQGASGNMSATTSGNYYTFNIENVASGVNAKMAILETNYNPVTISAVSNSTPGNATNATLITCTASAAPSSGEYVYVRYSTDINFVTSSAISQFYFNGTTGQALIPCQVAGPVYYYVFSSPNTATQIAADVATNGRIAYDMLALNLNNNGGPNYTYTQGSGTNIGGIYSVPSTCYGTVNSFVTALNTGPVSGPVTCYAIGGSATETAPVGGIAITQTGTAINPIVFQKFGSGSYTIQASSALTVGNINDAIIKLIGSDYISIDGLTLKENTANTTGGSSATNNMTEWGIALLTASTTDGAQNNTIQNNTISLDKTYRNTFGIYSNARATATAPTVAVDATALSGSNSGNKVYSNNISNVQYGITFIGTATPAFQDAGNDIGGGSAATGNTITNWGGNFPFDSYASISSLSYCISVNNQVGENVSYNTINSGTVGAGISTVFNGIRKDYTTSPTGTFTSTISYNTITMSSAFTGGNFECIRSQGMSALSTATININNNNLWNNAITAAGTSSAFGGIINASAPGTLNITGNVMRSLTSTSVSGGFTGISNSGAVVNNLNITNNQLGNFIGGAASFSSAFTNQINCITNSAAGATATINITGNSIDGLSVVTCGQVTFILNSAGGTTVNINNNLLGSTTGSLITFSGAQSSNMFAIYTQGTSAAGTVTIQGNDITGIVHTLTASSSEQLITNATGVLSQNILSNTFTNLILKCSGVIYFMVQSGALASGSSFACNNNQIVTGFSKTVTGGQVEFLHSTNSGSASGSTITETGNNFSNVTLTGSPPLFGWNESSGVSGVNGPTKTITGNTFNNITMGNALAAVIYLWKGTTVNCSSNTISNVSGPASILGIVNETTGTAGAYTISFNTISNLSSTAGDVEGIIGGTAVTSAIMSNNTIFNLSSTAASAVVAGIDASATTATISDNLIHGLSGAGTTSPNANGIIVKGGTTVNVFKNKIYDILESGAINTTAPAVNGLLLSGGTTVNAYNNFVSDLRATNSSFPGDAIRGISVTSTTASTTYNLYYNSIYINATSAGTNFTTSGIFHTVSATATTAKLNLIDNIVVNTSTANGTGVTVAYERSNVPLANYASTSDYNDFYAGTPGPKNLIFYDAFNSDQTLAAYQARVSSRDANSISILPNFTSSTDLHLISSNCQLDGRGTPVAGITTDIDGAARNVTTPDIGADEFTASFNTTLAGVVGTAICETRTVSVTGTTFTSNTCDLIATVLPSGVDPVAGQINTCVTLDNMAGALPSYNAEPYLTRHFDIEPASSNISTTSATITLYLTQAEFDNYNAKNGVWPDLPTGPADAAGISNLKVTQYHGTPTTTPSTPGNYTGNAGSGTYINPVDANIVWNGSYWAVTFDITGFSGFYIHTNPSYALPVSFNYLNGVKQGDKHLLSWSVTCNTTPRVTLTLERSADSRNFNSLYSITADAVRCNQPFNYTDAQPLAGINYYRLKIVDADGKITYSNTVALINGTKGFALMNVTPNPVSHGTFKLGVTSATNGNIEVRITDVQGRTMQVQTLPVLAGFNSISMNVSRLAPGVYYINAISTADKSNTLSFVVE